MAVCAVVLGIIALIKEKYSFKVLKNGVFLGVLLSAHYALVTVGLKTTLASNAGFLVGTFVVFVPVFSYLLFREKISLKKWAAVFISLTGLWLLTGSFFTMSRGAFLIVLAAAAGALHIVFLARMAKEEGMEPFSLTFYQFASGAVLVFLVILFRGSGFNIGGTKSIIFLILFAVIGNAFTTVGQVVSQKYMTAVKAALIIVLEPVFSALFAWTFGGEKFSIISGAGGLLIICGILVSEMSFKRINFRKKKAVL